MKKNKVQHIRPKMGRPVAFETPDELWIKAEEYFEWCDDNPWYKNEVLRSGDRAGDIIAIPTERPYTIKGLCVFIGITTQTLSNYGKKEDKKEQPQEIDFFGVVTHIKNILYTQKFEGATVGVFNPNIIAMDLGLTAKQDVMSGGEQLKKNTIIFNGKEMEI